MQSRREGTGPDSCTHSFDRAPLHLAARFSTNALSLSVKSNSWWHMLLVADRSTMREASSMGGQEPRLLDLQAARALAPESGDLQVPCH